MIILVLNSGSSSLKYKLFTDTKLLLSGQIDAIGKSAELWTRVDGSTKKAKVKAKDHNGALKVALQSMIDAKAISSLKDIKAVGHRVVHGGEFSQAAIINNGVISKIRKVSHLAPLHNPSNLSGILACKKLLDAKQVAVFDTAFHHSIPPKAYTYPLPSKISSKFKIKRYGFHGTSHKYISETVDLGKVVSCHLGNGSSITAILNGRSADTSMGFTPLEGIPMGTRSGSIDPSIPLFLLSKGYSKDKVNDILNKESGFKGLTGSPDMRVLYQRWQKGDEDAVLAMDILCYKIAFYIAGYSAMLNGLDAVVFTGGIGENAFYVRSKVCRYLSHLGVELDEDANRKNSKVISRGKVKVMVIPTDEELQIAKETLRLVNQ